MGGFMLKWTYKKSVDRGVDWTDLAQDMDRWWVVMRAAMNLGVP
jgi:hypothetical protein